MKKLKLFVFDMDGVIADTEPFHYKAKEMIMKELGIENAVNLAETVGLSNEALWAELIERFNLNKHYTELVQQQSDIILELMVKTNAKPIDGVLQLLDALDARGIKKGIASSSNRDFVDKVLKILRLEDRFDYTVAGDEVETKKPAPDVYKKVLKLAGVDASEACSVEDSTAGISAAVAAGLTCFGFANPGSGNQDLSLAAMVVKNLADIIPFL